MKNVDYMEDSGMVLKLMQVSNTPCSVPGRNQCKFILKELIFNLDPQDPH